MAYVTNDQLTDAYITTLITRCGFIDLTAQYAAAWGVLRVVQDLNGNIKSFSWLPDARDWLIDQYVIIQNS